jgi:eukaryotic-like serine/threonine-protein kinase
MRSLSFQEACSFNVMDIRLGAVIEGPDGPITIDSLLGRGGFGQVFAGHFSNGQRVAIKTVLTSALDADELRALQNEARHSQAIVHQNVVRVISFNDGEDESGQPPYLVMEFVKGGTLRNVIDAHRSASTKPSPDELRAMYLQIAEGMRAVNAKVVHRDLKPENVLVDETTNQLKITDFGLAKLADAATRSETFKGWGSRPYQAPEAFEQGPNTFAMDIYSAGVTFFELATLAWPVKPSAGDNSPLAWRNAHLLKPPANLRVARPDLPDSLVQLITLMLQKDPARRPQSWGTVIKRLQQEANTTTGRPDVTALVQKATSTLLHTTELQSKEREARERRAERLALLEQAFSEPVEVLRSLVDAFNDASDTGKLVMIQRDPFSVAVTGHHKRSQLLLTARAIDDLHTRYNAGIYRVIGVAQIDPMPSMSNELEALRDQESFGSFNLGYKVNQAADKFGNWIAFRFEHNPLMGRIGYPRWFAMDLDELSEQLQILNALGRYQHQTRALDHEWFQLLLGHLL